MCCLVVEPVRIHRLSVDDQQLSPTDIVPPPTLFADNISPSSSSLEKAVSGCITSEIIYVLVYVG